MTSDQDEVNFCSDLIRVMEYGVPDEQIKGCRLGSIGCLGSAVSDSDSNSDLSSGDGGDFDDVKLGLDFESSGGPYPAFPTKSKKLIIESIQKKQQKSPTSKVPQRNDVLKNVPNIKYVLSRTERLTEKLILPGKGSKKDGCGEEYRPSKFCGECGKPTSALHSCMSRVCPRCWAEWQTDRVQKSMERIITYQKKNHGVRSHHVVVSLDEWLYPKDTIDLGLIRSKVQEFLDEKGAYGGPIVFHPFRIKDELKDRLSKKITDEDGEEHGLWWGVRHDVLNLGGWREYVRYSPHFHALVLGDWLKEGEEEDQEYGMLFKRVDTPSSDEELAKMLIYIFSHLGIVEDRSLHSVTWFGELSYNVLSSSDINIETKKKVKVVLSQLSRGEMSVDECGHCGSKKMFHLKEAYKFLDDPDIHLEYEESLMCAFIMFLSGEVWTGPPPDDIDWFAEIKNRGLEDKLEDLEHDLYFR